MKMKRFGIMLTLLSLLAAPSFLQAAQNCDRQCLVTLMKDYLAALLLEICLERCCTALSVVDCWV